MLNLFNSAFNKINNDISSTIDKTDLIEIYKFMPIVPPGIYYKLITSNNYRIIIIGDGGSNKFIIEKDSNILTYGFKIKNSIAVNNEVFYVLKYAN